MSLYPFERGSDSSRGGTRVAIPPKLPGASPRLELRGRELPFEPGRIGYVAPDALFDQDARGRSIEFKRNSMTTEQTEEQLSAKVNLVASDLRIGG